MFEKYLRENIRPRPTLYKGGNRDYAGRGECKQQRVKQSAKEFGNGMAQTNGIERVCAVLKRGYTEGY